MYTQKLQLSLDSSLYETAGKDGYHIQDSSIPGLTEEYSVGMKQEDSVTGLSNVPSSQCASGTEMVDGFLEAEDSTLFRLEFLSCQQLVQREWWLNPKVFKALCQ